jgi:hypothetical protein
MNSNEKDAMVNEEPDPPASGCNIHNENEIEVSPSSTLRTDDVAATKLRPVRKRRNHWSQRKNKRKRSLSKKPKPKVFGEYWEIEHVLAVRERVVEPTKAATKKGSRTSRNDADNSYTAPTTITEFLIKWKGSFENSWEPEENLCDTALDDAHFLVEKEATQKLGLLDQKKTFKEQGSKRSSPRLKSTSSEIVDECSDDDLISEDLDGATDSDGINVKNQQDSYPDQSHEGDVDTLVVDTAVDGLIIEDTNFDWSNSSLKKMPIRRISVYHPDCKAQLMMSRLLGVPIVLTHHKGWVQFASRWLSLPATHSQSCPSVPNSGLDTAIAASTKTCNSSSSDSAFQSMNCFSKSIDLLGGGKDASSLNGSETGDIASIADCATSQSNVVSDEASAMEPSMLNAQENHDLHHVGHDGDNDKNQDSSGQTLLGSSSVNDSNCDEGKVICDDYNCDEGKVICDDYNCDEGKVICDDSNFDEEKVIRDDSICDDAESIINDFEPLDLTLPYLIDIDKMINDIGSEMVPILRKNYNDEQPIKAYMSVRRFLRDYWPSFSSQDVDKSSDHHQSKTGAKKLPLLYLHQWLFTASETAVPKLCNKNCLLPRDILNEDLLCYWYNHDQCAGDSPYQYLFMGSTDTMSRLHKDSGGLDIFIAPIVGEKEVTLVHRSDGPTSLYHLEANIDVPNFQKFPMLYSARVWQSTILPGEILVMSYGTFHQCRNITPCLSYHKFHLDSLNLHAFYESWRDRDAPDIDHEEVIWNAATELSNKIDRYTENFRNGQKSTIDLHPKLANTGTPADVVAAVSSLQCLHKVCLEISMRVDLINDHSSDWKLLVQDVEETLHEFRFRQSDMIPPLHQKLPRKTSAQRNHKYQSSKVSK